MQTLIIQPQNEEQFTAVESILKLLNINFTVEDDRDLPPYVIEGGTESFRQAQEGQLSRFTTIKEMLDL